MFRISTKIEWFVASETSHPSKDSIRICHLILELSATFAEFLLSVNGKNTSIVLKGSSLVIAPLTVLDSRTFTTSEVAADWHWL